MLLDPEAATPPPERSAQAGRLREPLLRMAALLRALGVRSNSGYWQLGITDDSASSLGMSTLRAPSVFNFYRPGYVPPNTALSAAGLVAPEFQITDETSVAGWLNLVKSVIDAGGIGDVDTATGRRDIEIDWTALAGLAADPGALVDRLILLMAPGQVSVTLRNQIRTAVETIAIPAGPATQLTSVAARTNRARLAVLLLAASPEFALQR